ncbi:unnamed protein product [Bursaphelenchus xylophilus]|uniref:(pine wood nematode) hypothetical protein n=1 Tax=Bursaphelenchus xylophilus TaxID=6326 RepID=A0A1I7S4W6_BURXY|nr:unnamed protein product [Bursaphelenchus xylophilus]CAG9117436.1 unnamed protein product [Bursaphelenchus xylophilus]
MLPRTGWNRKCTVITAVLLAVTVGFLVCMRLSQWDLSLYIYNIDLYTPLCFFTLMFLLISLLEFKALQDIAVFPFVSRKSYFILLNFYKVLFTIFFLSTVFLPFGVIFPPLDACKTSYFLAVNTVVSFLWMKTYMKQWEAITRYIVEMIMLNQINGTEISVDDALQSYRTEYEGLIADYHRTHCSEFSRMKQLLVERQFFELQRMMVAFRKELDSATLNKPELERLYCEMLRVSQSFCLKIEHDIAIKRAAENWHLWKRPNEKTVRIENTAVLEINNDLAKTVI